MSEFLGIKMVNRNADGILRGVQICSDWQAVANWVQRLRKVGVNYFVAFLDAHGPAIQFGVADWVNKGCIHFNTTETPLAHTPGYDPYGDIAKQRIAASIRRHRNNEERKAGKPQTFICCHCEQVVAKGRHCCNPEHLTASQKADNWCPECHCQITWTGAHKLGCKLSPEIKDARICPECGKLILDPQDHGPGCRATFGAEPPFRQYRRCEPLCTNTARPYCHCLSCGKTECKLSEFGYCEECEE